jgi:hypothetical protein
MFIPFPFWGKFLTERYRTVEKKFIKHLFDYEKKTSNNADAFIGYVCLYQ